MKIDIVCYYFKVFINEMQMAINPGGRKHCNFDETQMDFGLGLFRQLIIM